MRYFVLFFVVALMLTVPVMAETVTDVTGEYITEEEIVEGEDVLVGVSLMSLAPVGSDDTSGLKSVLLGLLGDYDPVIIEYEYRNTNSSYSSYLREVQPDYVWLCSCALLVVVIFCLFKLGGAVLCRR